MVMESRLHLIDASAGFTDVCWVTYRNSIKRNVKDMSGKCALKSGICYNFMKRNIRYNYTLISFKISSNLVKLYGFKVHVKEILKFLSIETGKDWTLDVERFSNYLLKVPFRILVSPALPECDKLL